MPDAPPRPSINTYERVGRYELLCEVARSSYGPLWAARDINDPGRLVAMRRIIARPPVDEAAVKRLTEVATALVGQRGPGLVPIIDVHVSKSELGIVSEYVEGETLRAIARGAKLRRSPLPIPVSVAIGLGALQALVAGQQAVRSLPDELRVAFVGVGPDNLVLGIDGEVHLLEAGVTAAMDGLEAFSEHPEMLGYRSPESIAGDLRPDGRADMYSLAVVLWELISNQTLFGIPPEAANAHRAYYRGSGTSKPSDLPNVRRVLTSLVSRLDSPLLRVPVKPSGELADVIARSLEREPADRFESLDQMIEELRLAAEGKIATAQEVADVLDKLSRAMIAPRKAKIERALATPPQEVRRSAKPVPRGKGPGLEMTPTPGVVSTALRSPLGKLESLRVAAPSKPPAAAIEPQAEQPQAAPLDAPRPPAATEPLLDEDLEPANEPVVSGPAAIGRIALRKMAVRPSAKRPDKGNPFLEGAGDEDAFADGASGGALDESPAAGRGIKEESAPRVRDPRCPTPTPPPMTASEVQRVTDRAAWDFEPAVDHSDAQASSESSDEPSAPQAEVVESSRELEISTDFEADAFGDADTVDDRASQPSEQPSAASSAPAPSAQPAAVVIAEVPATPAPMPVAATAEPHSFQGDVAVDVDNPFAPKVSRKKGLFAALGVAVVLIVVGAVLLLRGGGAESVETAASATAPATETAPPPVAASVPVPAVTEAASAKPEEPEPAASASAAASSEPEPAASAPPAPTRTAPPRKWQPPPKKKYTPSDI